MQAKVSPVFDAEAEVEARLATRLKSKRAFLGAFEQAYKQKARELLDQWQQEDADEDARMKEDRESAFASAKRLWLEKKRPELEAKLERARQTQKQLEQDIARHKVVFHPRDAHEEQMALVHLLKRLQEVESEISRRPSKLESVECVTCHEKLREVLFRPCDHLVMCAQCSTRVNDCPVCRKAIKERVNVTWS